MVEPPRIEYKGFKFKFSRKGDICRSLIVLTKYRAVKVDGSTFTFPRNNTFLVRKKQDLRSKYIFGPVSATFRRKRFKTLFRKVL